VNGFTIACLISDRWLGIEIPFYLLGPYVSLMPINYIIPETIASTRIRFLDLGHKEKDIK